MVGKGSSDTSQSYIASKWSESRRKRYEISKNKAFNFICLFSGGGIGIIIYTVGLFANWPFICHFDAYTGDHCGNHNGLEVWRGVGVGLWLM